MPVMIVFMIFTVPLTSLQVITSLIQFFLGGNSKNFGIASFSGTYYKFLPLIFTNY